MLPSCLIRTCFYLLAPASLAYQAGAAAAAAAAGVRTRASTSSRVLCTGWPSTTATSGSATSSARQTSSSEHQCLFATGWIGWVVFVYHYSNIISQTDIIK
jgi:hypothetical protein